MRNRFVAYLLLALAFLVSTSISIGCGKSPTAPPPVGTATLTVTVKGDDMPIVNVKVEVQDSTPISTMTDVSGTATFTGLPVGSYVVRVYKVFGFAFETENVSIDSPNGNVRKDITLRPADDMELTSMTWDGKPISCGDTVAEPGLFIARGRMRVVSTSDWANVIIMARLWSSSIGTVGIETAPGGFRGHATSLTTWEEGTGGYRPCLYNFDGKTIKECYTSTDQIALTMAAPPVGGSSNVWVDNRVNCLLKFVPK